MSVIIASIRNFFTMLDIKLIIAGLGMIGIFSLIVYIFIISVGAFQDRREAIKVALPEIDGVGKGGFKKAQFTNIEDLSIELIDTDKEGKVEYEVPEDDEEIFLTTLSLEAKQFIPADGELVEMPEVGEIDLEAIKKQKAKELDEKNAEDLTRIRELAKVDNQGASIELEDELMKDINKADNKGDF